MNRVLVTGASGFVGGHVVHALHERGIACRCLVRRSSHLDFIKGIAPELAFGDVTQPETLGRALEGVDQVIHCAGLTKAASRDEFFRVNETGVRNLFSACLARKGSIRKIVHVSSLAALGPAINAEPVGEESRPRPISDYGESKLAGQRIAESCMPSLSVSIVMPPAVYGPNDPDFLVYFKFVAWGIIPLIGSRARFLSLIYARDLAAAIADVLAAESSAGKSYLVDDGHIYTWTDVAAAIGKAMAKKPRPIRLPMVAVRGLGIMGDLAAKITGRAGLVTSQKIREFLPESWTCSSRRIGAEIGFRPQYSLEEGIRETLLWYRETRWL